MNIEQLIRFRRKELGLTLKQVADALGVAESTVSRYESSEIRNMGIDKIEALAKVLAVKPSYLMGWEDTKPSPPPQQILDEYINRTFTAMNNINEEGKEQVADYAELLDESGKYQPEPTTSKVLDISEYASTHTIGTAAAGSGFNYGDHIIEHKLFMTTDIPDHDFSLNVKGDSMFPTIIDGETIFVIKDYDKIDNDIYVLDIDGETTVKRVKFGKDEIILISDNDEYDDRIVTGYELANTRILGRVVGWEMPT